MAQPDFTPFPALMEQVALLCGQRQTGTVMLVSDDNRMAQIHLRDGEIVFVMCRGRRGRDALGIMRTMQAARLSFVAGGIDNTEGIDWPTKAVLDYLSGAAADLPGDAAAGIAPAPALAPRPAAAAGAAAARPAAAPVAAPAGGGVNAATKGILEKIMLTYIGPMAQIVCGDHFANATDARSLTLALSNEIPGKPAQAKFKAEVAKLLDLPPFD